MCASSAGFGILKGMVAKVPQFRSRRSVPIRPKSAPDLGTGAPGRIGTGRRSGVGVVRALVRLAVLGVVAAVVLAAMTFPFVGGGGLLAAQVSASENGLTPELQAGDAPAVTTVTDSTGKPIAYLYDQFRVPVPAVRRSRPR